MILKEARKRAGYSTEALAEKVGVSSAAINRYELGKRVPKVEIAKRIGEVLNVNWWELMDNKKAC